MVRDGHCTREKALDSSLQGIATELLNVTGLDALRKEARRNRRWAAIYSGFRADSLTRPLFVRGAMAFARDPAQLHQLCTVFLDSVEAPVGKDQKARFAEAAKLDGLDDRAKTLCTTLAEADLATLPAVAPQQDAEPAPIASSPATEDSPAPTSDEPAPTRRRGAAS